MFADGRRGLNLLNCWVEITRTVDNPLLGRFFCSFFGVLTQFLVAFVCGYFGLGLVQPVCQAVCAETCVVWFVWVASLLLA